MRLGHLLLVVLILLPAGCNSRAEPLRSHGKTVAEWLEELKHPDPAQRKKAVLALGHVGNADAAAIPAVVAAIGDPDSRVRDQAVLSLLRLGPLARQALPALTAAQNDPDDTVREHAVRAVARIEQGK
jgi:HEAT repeat protein